MNVISPADLPRFGQLGVIANFQPLWATINPYIEMTAVRVGPERMAYHYPSKSLLNGGAMLAYGADWPVASANPLEGIEVALTRRTPGAADAEPLLPNEGVTLEEAIAAYTINVAHASHLDEEIGSITPGKSADLVVLDQDIFSIPANAISKTKVQLTLFRGAAVHDELAEF
jgi:predicted amidohydrolase YtcJ